MSAISEQTAVGLASARWTREWFSTLRREDWPTPPVGDGRPAMLIPGFLAGDGSLTRLALWLRDGGYSLTRSGLVWNVDCTERTVETVIDRLEAAVEKAGQPALLVGQSRGGTMGRLVAVRRPDLVDTLVTLGSPVQNMLAVRPHTWLAIGAVGFLGTIGMPNMFRAQCLSGACCAQTRRDYVAPFPEDVRYFNVFSQNDEIVRWRQCVEDAGTPIECQSSHIGMGFDARVWRTLAANL